MTTLLIELARLTGTTEAVQRVAHGLNPDPEPDNPPRRR